MFELMRAYILLWLALLTSVSCLCSNGETVSVSISSPSTSNYLDETSYTLFDSFGGVVGTKAGFAAGTITTTSYMISNAPLSFYLETKGVFNDNDATYSVSCGSIIVISGVQTRGTEATYSLAFTSVPTKVPTRSPTAQPTRVPTPPPTTAPSFTCDAYSTSNTNSALQNTISCTFYACPNQVLTFSTCGACSGDTYLRLYDFSNVQLSAGDDSCPSGGHCTYFSYTMPSSGACQYVTLKQGCYGSSSCSGTTLVTRSGGPLSNAPTLQPTVFPTRLPSPLPTKQPTRLPTAKPTASTLIPSPAPNNAPTATPTHSVSYLSHVSCPWFSTSNTLDARVNTVSCYFLACERDRFEISMCHSCKNDAYLRLYDPSGKEIDASDDSCDKCPQLTNSRSETACGVYEIRQGCYGDGACSGETRVVVTSQCPDGFSEYDGSCYYFNEVRASYSVGEQECTNLNAQPLSINSLAEANWLINTYNVHDTYVGYTDVDHEGTWVWADGESTYENWGAWEPNGGTDDNCAILTSDGYLFDVSCSYETAISCELACSFCPSAFNTDNEESNSSTSRIFIIAAIVAGLALCIICCCVGVIVMIRKKKLDRRELDFGDIVMTEAPRVTAHVITVDDVAATHVAASAPPMPAQETEMTDRIFAKMEKERNDRLIITIPEAPSAHNI